MSEAHLSNDEFFLQLTTLFDARRQKDHGSVFLTQKRLTILSSHPSSSEEPQASLDPSSSSAPFPDLLTPLTPHPILIRATNGANKSKRAAGQKIKLSTVVPSEALERFFVRYAEVCKSGMSGLKKRDRSKAKEKLKAKKRKQAGVGVEEKKA